MNTGENKVLLTIELDEQATEKRIIEIRKQLDFLGEAAKGLKKDFKDGTIGTDEYYGGLERVKRQSTELTKELALQRKSLENLDKSEKAATGSLVDLKAKLSNATKAYGDLSREQRNNADIGGQLAKTVRAYSDELKEAEEKTGLYNRSVGDYAKGIRVFGVSIGEAQEALKGGVEGVQVFAKSLTTLKGGFTALAAVPIVLFLVAIIAFFKSTDEGADKLEQGIGFLTEAFDALLKGLAPAGKLLADLFTAPIETVKKLISGTDEYNVQLDKVVANSIKAGLANVEYIKTMQNVEDSENALIAQREKVGLQTDQALLKVKDRSLTEKQKIQILRDAGKAETELGALTLKNAKMAFDAIAKLNAERGKSRVLTDDEVKAQLEAEAGMIRAQRESLNTLQAIRNRETAQIEESAAKRKQAAADAIKAEKEAAQNRVYQAELDLIQAKKRGDNLLNFQINLLKKQASLEEVGLKKNAVQRKLIEAKLDAEIANAKIKSALEAQAKLSDIQQSILQSSLAIAVRGSKQAKDIQVAELRRQLRDEQLALKAQLDQKLITQEQYTEKNTALVITNGRAIDDINKAFDKAEIDRLAELAQLKVQTELDTAEDLLSIRRNEATKSINIEEQRLIDLVNLAEISETEKDIKIDAIRAAAEVKRKAIYKQILDDELKEKIAIIDAGLSASVRGSKQEFALRRQLLKVQLAEELLNTEASEKQKDAIKAKYKRAQIEVDKEEQRQLVDNIVNATQEGLTAVSGFFQAAQQERQNAFDAEQDAAVKSAGENADLRAAIEKNFAAKKAELDKKAANERKKIALAEAAIGIAKGIIAALELPPPFNAIQAALVGLTGLAQIAVISSQKFNRGGVPNQYHSYQSDGRGAYLSSGPGSSTSDSIPARLSVKESVMNAKATAKYYDTLSAMNAETGGVSFPGAKPISTMPAPVQSFKYGVVGLGQDTGATIGRYVDEAVSRIQPVLVLETLNQVNGRVNRTQVRQTIK